MSTIFMSKILNFISQGKTKKAQKVQFIPPTLKTF